MAALLKLLRADLRHHGARLAVLGLGLSVATALFVLLLGLGLGLREAVLVQLSHALPGHMIEVRPRHLQVGPLDLAMGGLLADAELTMAQARALAALPQVRAAHPVIDVPLPMSAQGGQALVGRALHAEIFMDALAEPLGLPGADEPQRIAPFVDVPDGPIPVLVSPQLVALYNTTVAPALGAPNIVPEALVGFTFDILVGRSQLARVDAQQRQGRIRAQVVGLSALALPLGISVPLATGRRLMREFGPEDARSVPADPGAEVLRAILLEAASAESVPAITQAVTDMGLHVDEGAVPLRAILRAMVLAMAGLGGLVLALTGVGLMHALAAYVGSRRRELALVRAVGASRGFVVVWMLASALGLGLAAGLWGICLAKGAALGLNHTLGPALRGIPLMPAEPFVLPWSVLALGLVTATATAVLGAIAPALRAARADIAWATHGA